MTPAPWDPTKRAAATEEHARKYAAANALGPTTDETRKPRTQIAGSRHAPAQK